MKRPTVFLAAAMICGAAGCKAMNKPSVAFTSGAHVLEYGIDLWDTEEELHPDIMQYIRSSKGELSLDDTGFDPLQLGEQSLLITAEDEESEVTEELKVLVQDTKAPVIELAAKEVYTKPGVKFDPSENILSVTDPAEGDLLLLEMRNEDGQCFMDEPFDGWGFYALITGELDTDTEGEYPVKVIASDSSGNITEAEFTVVVSETKTAGTAEPLTVQGKADDPVSSTEKAEERFLKAQEYICGAAGGTWEDGCVFDGEFFDEDSGPEEEMPDELFEESEEDIWLDEETDPGYEEEYEEDTDSEYEDDYEEEEPDNQSDNPEQDCYDMGGVWYPGDGCAWPDDFEE